MGAPISARSHGSTSLKGLSVMDIRLGDNTVAAVKRGPVVLIPMGALRDHGQGLPLDSEIEVAVAVAEIAARALNRRGQATVVAPALNYGLTTLDASTPGQIGLNESGLRAAVRSMVESAAAWAGQVILVTLDAKAEEVLARSSASWNVGRCLIRVIHSDLSGRGIGTNRAWTSLMLFLKPWNVRLDGRSGHRVVANLRIDSSRVEDEVLPGADEGRELLDKLAWQLIGELAS